MSKSNSKRSKTKSPKKAAQSGMVVKNNPGGSSSKFGSMIPGGGHISSAKKGNSVSAPRKAGGS
ncbi:MAG TPA: hypothetical protein PKM63_08390 [Panacibacter sp.]|nr:hypothetical protein [Panacibacter sp.]HNP44285.1 hypothetical protein [Panacibacter sp.]